MSTETDVDCCFEARVPEGPDPAEAPGAFWELPSGSVASKSSHSSFSESCNWSVRSSYACSLTWAGTLLGSASGSGRSTDHIQYGHGETLENGNPTCVGNMRVQRGSHFSKGSDPTTKVVHPFGQHDVLVVCRSHVGC